MSQQQNAAPFTINLNGQDFAVRALNWKQLRELRPEIMTVQAMNATRPDMFDEEQAKAILKLVTAALQRTNNTITEEFVEEHLDLYNVGQIVKVVFGASFPQPSGDNTGEAKAAASPN